MGVGRVFCLTVPFAFTLASLVCICIIETAQITNKDLYFAKFHTQNLSVSVESAAGLVGRGLLPSVNLKARDSGIAHLHTEALSSSSSAVSSALSGTNLTASDLGLADYYTVGLWNYCNRTSSNGSATRSCSDRKSQFYFDPFSVWNLDDTTAETAINSTILADAMKAYQKGSKWTWWMYLLAMLFSICEILFGFVAVFSRIGSCSATIISSAASVTIIIASVLSTVMWSVVVASFNKELKQYGLSASISTHMIGITWLAVAFSIAAGFFWMISTCCCGTTSYNYRSSRNRRVEESNIPMNGPYQQVHEPAMVSGPYGQPTVYNPPTAPGFGSTEYGHTQIATGMDAKPIKNPDTAYEPYRHGNV